MTLIEHQPRVRQSLRMSEDEYIDWSRGESDSEWVAGQVYLKIPIEEKHDEIQALIRAVLESFVKRRRLGKVRGPQFTMRLPQKPSRRDPDLLFVASATEGDRLTPTVLNGPADLVVEIVSPESQLRDYHEKLEEYRLGGVREYWIVSPLASTVDLLVLDDKTGEYQSKPVDEKTGRFYSSVVQGFWLHPDDLFKEPRIDSFSLSQKLEASA